MKILYLSDDFPPAVLGGAGVIAFGEALGMHARGHQVLVVTTVRHPKDAGTIEYAGLKIVRLHSNYHERWRAYISLYNFGLIKEIAKIIQEFGPDVVHAHNIHTHLSYASLKIASKSGAKVFLTLHDVMTVEYGKVYTEVSPRYGTEVTPRYQSYYRSVTSVVSLRWRYNPFRNIAIKHYLGYAKNLFAVSDALRIYLESRGICNIKTLYNGIDTSRFGTEVAILEKFKAKYELNDKVIFFGGRLSGAKGAFVALDALNIVREKITDAKLLIVGAGNSKISDDIAKYASKLNLSKNVVFTGWLPRDEVKYAIAASNVVTVLSLCFDAFPNINLEAMALGKPLVATKFGGSNEAVVDGQTGFIVNPNNVGEVADKILELLQNDSLAQKMGLAAYKRAVDKFGLDDHLNALESWYH